MTQNADLPLLGMHCSACAVRIEKALAKAEGVEVANVNFATTRATIQYDPSQTDPQKLREVVQKAGYDAILAAPQNGTEKAHESLSDVENAAREAEYRGQKNALLLALALTIPVAIVAMGGHLFPALERFFNFPGRVYFELLLTTPVLFWAGREFFYRRLERRAAPCRRHEHARRDWNARGLSLQCAATFAPQLLASGSQNHAAHSGAAHGVYYEVAAIVITLHSHGPFARSTRPSAHRQRHSRADGVCRRKQRALSATEQKKMSPSRKCAWATSCWCVLANGCQLTAKS
jgi:Cu+-exporting ATPase